MISILRQPDIVYGATEKTPFRFEEKQINDVKYSYSVSGESAKITIYPSGAPIKYLKLRFNGDLSNVDRVYGDQWERAGLKAYLEWRSVMASRVLPWFCYVMAGDEMSCYGVKTGDGYIELTLLRGAGYCFHPIRERQLYPEDRYLPRIDCGRYEFNLRLFTGSVEEVCEEAESFACRPYAVNVFPTGGSMPTIDVKVDKGVVVSSFAKSENGGYYMRLWNPSENGKDVNVQTGNLKKTIAVNPYEIVSLKIDKEITAVGDEIVV